MRTAPLIGRKPWFAPRWVGWGLGPASAEGSAATAATVAVTLRLRRQWPERQMLRLMPAVGLVFVALVKGTAPGGPRAWRAFRASGPGRSR